MRYGGRKLEMLAGMNAFDRRAFASSSSGSKMRNVGVSVSRHGAGVAVTGGKLDIGVVQVSVKVGRLLIFPTMGWCEERVYWNFD